MIGLKKILLPTIRERRAIKTQAELLSKHLYYSIKNHENHSQSLKRKKKHFNITVKIVLLERLYVDKDCILF